jgi:prepilin-type N-terminal cleavage/methylation domain-containing protein
MKKINFKTKFKMFQPVRNSAGFTLIEALVSMAILSVGILGLSSSVTSVVHFQNKSNNMSQATLLTTAMIEQVKRAGTNELSGGIYSFLYLVDPVNGYITPANGFAGSSTQVTANNVNGIFNTETVIQVWPPGAPGQDFSNLANQTAIDMVEVQVTTSWNDSLGNPQSVVSGTVMHKRRVF